MKNLYFTSITILASSMMTYGNPVPNAAPDGAVVNVVRRSGISAESQIVSDCKRSRNCEVYDDPIWGIMTRFKKGMEPGSPWYETNVRHSRAPNNTAPHTLTARGTPNNPHANMQIGHNHINYGTKNPWDVLTHLYDFCNDKTCTNDHIYVGSQAVGEFVQTPYSGTQPKWYSMIVSASANIDGWAMRNRFIEALQTLSIQKQEWSKKHWVYRYYNGATGSWDIANQGDIWECMQADWYYVAQYGWNHDYQGSMTVNINSDFQPSSGYNCASVKDYLTGVMSLWGPIFGLAASFIFADCS